MSPLIPILEVLQRSAIRRPALKQAHPQNRKPQQNHPFRLPTCISIPTTRSLCTERISISVVDNWESEYSGYCAKGDSRAIPRELSIMVHRGFLRVRDRVERRPTDLRARRAERAMGTKGAISGSLLRSGWMRKYCSSKQLACARIVDRSSSSKTKGHNCIFSRNHLPFPFTE